MNYSVKNKNEALKIHAFNIYPCPYNEYKKMECVSFETGGDDILVINSKIPIKDAVIRPLSLNLAPEIKDGQIIVKIERAMNFSLEINGGYDNNLLVIANPKRKAYEDNSIVFEAGIHSPGIIKIENDNTTVILEDGAYVHGKIHAENVKNLTIRGTGILSMEKYPRDSELKLLRCVDIINCRNVSVSDIIIHDSVDWSFRLLGCDDCHIDNVKIIGSRGNSDGFDVCGSRNVTVENCFTRVWDDSLVLKAFDNGDVDNILFRKCVLWNDFARPIEVGVEIRADNARNIVFSDIDVIHSPTGYPILGIHHGDRAIVSDVLFSDIRIEDTPGAQLFDIRVTDSVWNKDKIKGKIKNITFENINFIGKPGMPCMPEKSRIQGFSEKSGVSEIHFNNIKYLGKTITDIKALNMIVGDFVDKISLNYDKDNEPVVWIDTEIKEITPFSLGKDGYYHGRVEISAVNNGQHTASGEIHLDIFPVNTAEYEKSSLKFSLSAGERVSKTYEVIARAGKYCLRVNSSDSYIDPKWLFKPLDLIIGEDLENAPKYKFTNYYNVKNAEISLAVANGALLIKNTSTPKNSKMIIYTAMPTEPKIGEVMFTVEETDFGEAPAIVLGAKEYELAPQLRCPAEITYVFKNEPKVKEIIINELTVGEEILSIPLEKLGIHEKSESFWLEIELLLPETEKYRYPYTLFHSAAPRSTAHMYCSVIPK